jgi:hypothetical protein
MYAISCAETTKLSARLVCPENEAINLTIFRGMSCVEVH